LIRLQASDGTLVVIATDEDIAALEQDAHGVATPAHDVTTTSPARWPTSTGRARCHPHTREPPSTWGYGPSPAWPCPPTTTRAGSVSSTAAPANPGLHTSSTSPRSSSTLYRHLCTASRLTEANTLAGQLQHALDSRIVIEQAKGIISERHGLGMDLAFQTLRSRSRRRSTKLHEVCRQVVDGRLDVAPETELL
jgi:hypothetical protein